MNIGDVMSTQEEGLPKQNTMLPYAYFRKKIVPFQDATISIASQSLEYGTTCFGGIRGFYHEGKTIIFRLQDHYKRLYNGSKILEMDVALSWDNFQDAIAQLIKANEPKGDFYIRPLVYTEYQALKPRFDGISFDLAIYMFPLLNYFDPSKGLRLMISSWRKVSDAAMPTKAKAGGCYLNSALAATEARNRGFDDALMMDDQGNIVEASAANIIIVYQGEVIMPETGSALLEGITRRTVIEFLEEEGIKVRAERLDRSMVYTCDELIVTGTAAQIAFAQSVDNRQITDEDTPGPICLLLRKKIADAIHGNHPKSKQWLTEYKY